MDRPSYLSTTTKSRYEVPTFPVIYAQATIKRDYINGVMRLIHKLRLLNYLLIQIITSINFFLLVFYFLGFLLMGVNFY